MNHNKIFLDQNKSLTSPTINDLQPKLLSTPSCSKFNNLIEDEEEKTSYNFNVDVHVSRIETIPEENDTLIGFKEFNNAFDTISNYQMYDENNNCILTDLNELGMFNNIHSENAEYNSNEGRLLIDKTLNDEKFNNVSSVLNKCFSEGSGDITNNSTVVPNNVNVQINITNAENNNEQSEKEYEMNFLNISLDSSESFDIGLDFEKDIKFNIIMKYNKDIFENDKTESAKDIIKDLGEISTYSDSSVEANNCKLEAITLSSADNNDKPQVVDPIISFDKYQTVDSDICSGYCSSDFEFIDEAESKKGGLIIKCNSKSKVNNMNKEKKNISEEYENDSIIYDYFNIPGPSVSSTSVPIGNEYNDLFVNVPYLSNYMENKAIHSISGKHAEYEGIGFDMQYFKADSESDDEYKEEVDETVKVIFSMYPQENPVRRPRRKT